MEIEDREGQNATTGCWIDKVVARRIALWTAVYLGIIWGMASWLERPLTQPIHNDWVLIRQGLASYPMWGYSLLMNLFGSVNGVVVLQSVLGALATAALMVRLSCLAPRLKGVTTTLFLLSLPWLSFMAYAYQMPMSSALMVLALLALEMALGSGRITWGIVAGVLCGFGQNFRSELVLLPAAVLVVVLVLNKLQRFTYPSIKPLAVCAGVALMVQLPWALNCYVNAGRFSLSESNLGHVAFASLGKLPGNPWNIVCSDEFAQETVDKAGLECSSLSFEGGDYLKRRFAEAVMEYPGAYLRCLGRRVWRTVWYPFEFLPLAATPAEQQAARGLVRMINPWAAQPVATDAEPVEGFASKIKVGCILPYAVAQGVLIRAVSLLGIIGLFLAMGKAPFRLSQPIILCLGIALAYRFGMNLALIDSGKYMTGVYLCYLPFAANTLWIASRRFWGNDAAR